MGNVIYVDENGKVKRSFKKKFDDACDKVKRKAKEIWETTKENKEVAIAVGSVAVPAFVEFVKLAAKSRTRKEENERKKKSMWDPVEGHWWDLRREPTNSELLIIERRVKNGESRGEVLQDMRLLAK